MPVIVIVFADRIHVGSTVKVKLVEPVFSPSALVIVPVIVIAYAPS